jgi:DNA-binding SARP family transcriptional activator
LQTPFGTNSGVFAHCGYRRSVLHLVPQRGNLLSPFGAGSQVSVLGSFGFSAVDGSRPLLAAGSQRLLAYLALNSEPVARSALAGSLWPEVSDERAGSSLRSALTRLGSTTRDAVSVTDVDISLADDVVVDIRSSQGLARSLLEPEIAPAVSQLGGAAISVLSRELLPDWYDDWVVPEAEEWRQLRLHALESLSALLTIEDRHAHAMGAALAALRADPLRESANAAVIRVHLAEGNQADAVREFRRYRALLQRELGVEPTDALFELVGVAPMHSRRAESSRAGTRAAGTQKWADARTSRPT